MGTSGLPSNYLQFNTQQTKNPIVVVDIAGCPDILTNADASTRVLYGDPGVTYGAGYVYGGLRPYVTTNADGSARTFKDYLMLDRSSMSISQRLEPEQGKASVATISLGFLDKDGYMTTLVSPGQVLEEILGTEVNVYLGYKEISYPQDFFRVFRGFITGVQDGPGWVVLQLSDPNVKRRQQLFFMAQTKLSSAINNSQLTIPVSSTSNFFEQVDQPAELTAVAGPPTADPSVKTYVKVDDEWIEYTTLPTQDSDGVYLQGVWYSSKLAKGTSPAPTVTIIGGGTAGAEVVTMSGINMTVKVQSGVSTATQVVAAVNASAIATFTAETTFFQMATTQAAHAAVSAAGDIGILASNGVLFTSKFNAPFTIQTVNDPGAGAPLPTCSAFAIQIALQAGIATADLLVTFCNAELFGPGQALEGIVGCRLLSATSGSTVQPVYGPSSFSASTAGQTFLALSRGARGTTAAAHDSGATVAAGLQLGSSNSAYATNAIDMALKLMLSGWGGPWISNVAIAAIGPNPDPDPSVTITSMILLPTGKDAVKDYNLTAGDFVAISGSGTSTNNDSWAIARFEDFAGGTNRAIIIQQSLVKEPSTTAVVSFRSQYDTYPVDAGLKMVPSDVDIAGHLAVKQTFLGASGNDYIFFLTATQDSGKDFLETQIYFPVGAYSLTRRGQVSCGYHSPPIGSQGMIVLDETNIIDPQNGMIASRATNQRAFFDEIDITFNYDDAGNPRSTTKIAGDGITKIGITNVLPINAQGVYDGYSSTLLQKRAFFLLSRYNRGATIIDCRVNWAAGSVLEAGDVVVMNDKNNVLQIANFGTGLRGITGSLFEVIDRTFDIRSGNTSLKLLGNLGANASDRFATISPASVVGTGSTATEVIITDSFGSIFPGDEAKKWENYLGLQVYVHSRDYSVGATVTLNSIDSANRYKLHVDALGFTPAADYIVEVAYYPTSADPTVNALIKTMHASLDPTVTVVSGTDTTHFTVGAGDASKFQEGMPLRVHSTDFARDSTSGFTDLTVESVSGTTIETSGSMGFVPQAGDLVDLIGFPDFNAASGTGFPYRWI